MSSPARVPGLFEDLERRNYQFQDPVDRPRTSDSQGFAVVHDSHDTGQVMDMVYSFSEQAVLPLDKDEDFFSTIATASRAELSEMLSAETISLAYSEFESIDSSNPTWADDLARDWIDTAD